MAEIMEEAQDPLRSYQWEMLETCLRRNTIVVMPTGSGKTRVAIERIRRELEQSDSTLTWFLANSVELSGQHHRTLTQHLPAYNILSLTGADGVDNWSDQHTWDRLLSGVRVMVGTPKVLLDALSHGFVKISRLGLLIFDEAHHCIKNHPMNSIMTHFYHPAKSRGEALPHITALTASPVTNPKVGSLEQLEKSLNARVATPTRSLDELMRHVYPPHIEIVSYEPVITPMYPGVSNMCRTLHSAVLHYDFHNDPWVLELRQCDDERSQRSLDKVFDKRKTKCSEQLAVLDRSARIICCQLGFGPAEIFIRDRIEQYQRAAVRDILVPDSTVLEQQHLLGILEGVLRQPFTTVQGSLSPQDVISAKAQCLISLLQAHAGRVCNGEDREVKAIIFARERSTVTSLCALLQALPKITNHYQVGCFLGTSSFDSRGNISNGVNAKQQAQDLKDFRNEVKNLIIATSVLEEGIDVQACNLVINFDAPDTLVAFLQRRGRVRQKHSSYYVLAEMDDTKIDPAKWQAEEARMQHQYMDDNRAQAAAESMDELAASERCYGVPSTGALLTLNEAKAHLFHFCSTSTEHANNYIDTRPDFHAVQIGIKQWEATVTLPSFVHANLRTARSSQSWHSEAAAVKDAAFEAYVTLHKAGLLSDNLLPLVEDYPGAWDPETAKQPSIITVAQQWTPWLARESEDDAFRWHKSVAKIERGSRGTLNVPLLLPRPLLQEEAFDIYWNETTTYQVCVSASDSDVGIHDTQLVQRNTDIILRNVHASRMADRDQSNYAVLINVDETLHDELVPATEYVQAAYDLSQDYGLVTVAGRGTKLHMFQRWAIETPSAPPSGLILTSFPKRRDFLHPLRQRQATVSAYTIQEILPASECAFKTLPSSYSDFSALYPSIVHRLDLRLVAQELQTELLKDLDILDSTLILEAITAPSAGQSLDYNRLEYLGDGVLKFCASLQVTAQHPTWPERYLTLEKGRLVSNRTLCRAGRELVLDKYILTKPFTGAKWRPVRLGEGEQNESTRDMPMKTIADVVEALIGAAFVDGGLEKAHRCLQFLLPGETWWPVSHSCNSLVADVAATPYRTLEQLELLVGHRFKHPTLLVEATTHASLPFQRIGMSYERLEFLGDAVLDLIITPKLYAHARRWNHNEMTDMLHALVNAPLLGYCCLSYGIEQAVSVVAKEAKHSEVRQGTRTIHLHDFIRASGQLLHARQASLESFEKHRGSVEAALERGTEYPWCELLTMNLPKFFSDLVESVLAALYLDTGGDLGVCEQFVEKLGILEVMRTMLDGNIEVMAPKARLGIAAGNREVRYSTTVETVENKKAIACSVRVGEENLATISGCASKPEAEAKGAIQALSALFATERCKKGRFDATLKAEQNDAVAGAAVSEEQSEDEDA